MEQIQEEQHLATQWSSIIGQEQLTENLQNALKFNKISHAYIIQGERLSGKRMIADIFARALQCEYGVETEKQSTLFDMGLGEVAEHVEQVKMKPCNQCRSCKQAINRNHPDIIYVEHDKPNVISVDNIRTQINSDIAIKPYSGTHKIYIMDEAEKMNTQAQNALLKTLEEPPEYAVIFLLTTNVEALLPTILSRCVVLNIKPVSDERIKTYLMEQIKIPDYRASICASFARGNVGRAKQLASNEEFDHLKSEALHTLKSIFDMEVNQIATAVKKMTEEKLAIDDYLDLCFIWYRDVLLYKACGDRDHLIFKEDLLDIQRMAEKYSYEDIEQIIQSIDRAKGRLRANVNFDLTMELLFMDMQRATK